MGFGRNRPGALLILVVVLGILLPLLAVFQYRWVGQVSRFERERLQSNLTVGAARFSEDFDREIARAYLTFQVDALTLRNRSWGNFASRYNDWVSRAPYPGLIQGVYLVDTGETGSLQVSSFNRDTGQFEIGPWPPELSGWRDRLNQQYVSTLTSARGLTYGLDPIADDIPALIIPVFTFSVQGNNLGINIERVFGCTVVILDLDYVKRELIPGLARRYFYSQSGPEYDIDICTRNAPSETVYQSNPATANGASDAEANIFAVRFNDFKNLLFESGPGAGQSPGGAAGQSASGAISIVRIRPSAGAPTGTGMLNEDNSRWQLRLRHRAGSLERAVAIVRIRNLIISFGILLVLGASVAMIIASTRRAQRLAHQQMEFAAGVSHELRTPLAVICSAGENLADGVIDGSDQIKRYGRVITNEGRRLTEMIDQVMEFSGIQSGRKTYDRRPIDISELVEGAVASCKAMMAEKRLCFEKTIAPGLPAARGDAAALRRAIQNLISNAVKYGSEGGSVGVRAESKLIQGGVEVQITVEDKGPGIDPDDLPYVFDPFYRGRNAIAAQLPGSGLGLSLVKHIIEAHHGRVTVRSTPREGSAFTLHLPAETRDEAAAEDCAQGKYEQANFAR